MLEKKEFFFFNMQERQLLSPHLSIHGLGPYAFEEGQESRLGL
jgi:hypothetical protein